MRKITIDSVAAFMSGERFSKQNMLVEVDEIGDVLLKLHGNTIAKRSLDGVLSITNAGWATNTTKERLNGIDGVSIYQQNWDWYLNGEKWDGSWRVIK